MRIPLANFALVDSLSDKTLLKKDSVNNSGIDWIVFAILLYIYRTTVPVFKYPFIIILSGLIIYSLIYRQDRLKSASREFVRSLYLSILLFMLLVFSFFISNKMYLLVFKEIINALILITLFYLILLNVRSIADLRRFYRSFILLCIAFAGFISIALLSTFFNISSFVSSIALSYDYNFGSLPILIGIICLFFLLLNPCSRLHISVYNLLLIVFSFTIIFSGSRRGMASLSFILIGLFFINILASNKKVDFFLKVKQSTRFFLLSFILILIIIIGFVFVVPEKVKRSTLGTMGISVGSYKQVMYSRLYKYFAASNVEYDEFKKLVWNEKPESSNPETGWDERISKTVFPLSGKNVEIIPNNAIGYLMDKSCDYSTWDNNAYSYTNISNLFQVEADSTFNGVFYASVYCYVSEDFNGTWARLSAEGKATGKVIHEYDLSRKGEWQKLKIAFTSSENLSPVYLYWAKYGTTDFSNLVGYVVYAYPEYGLTYANPEDPDSGWGSKSPKRIFPLTGENVEIVPKNSVGYKLDNSTSAATWDNNAYSFTDISILFIDDRGSPNMKKISASVYCYVSVDFDGTWVAISDKDGASSFLSSQYDLTKKGIWQKLEFEFECDEESDIPVIFLYWSKYGVKDFSSVHGYVVYAYPQYFVKNNIGNISSSGIPKRNEQPLEYSSSGQYYSTNRIMHSIALTNKPGLNVLGTYQPVRVGPRTSSHYKTLRVKNLHEYSYFSFVSCISTIDTLPLESIDNDPVRQFAAKLISEDTSYFDYEIDLGIDTIANSFIGERLMRWQFALQIYFSEYNWKKKLWGGGFNHLNWFGYRFLHEKTMSDYPHNPFLSILLYSGLIGLVLYIIFMYQVFFLYLKFIKEYYLFFIFFLLTFFFSFFSSGSPFDPPIMGFFSIVPFLINQVHKNLGTK